LNLFKVSAEEKADYKLCTFMDLEVVVALYFPIFGLGNRKAG
jgi:hypothetical protein